MSTLETQKRLALEQKAIQKLRERISREAYMSVPELMEVLNLSREKIEALPVEVLPYADHGSGRRALRRYHPADVLALDAVMRQWKRAQDEQREEAFLSERREVLEARDEAAMEIADHWHEKVSTGSKVGAA